MVFASKIYLILLIIVVPLLIALIIFSNRKYAAGLKAFAAEKLISRLVSKDVLKIRRIKNILLLAVIALLMVTLADFRFGSKMVELKQKSIDVIICVDCSKSMLAEDIKPNRLARAKELFSVLIDKLQGNRIGVISFSGIAFTQCPITFDFNAVKMLLSLIDTDLIPYGGTSIGKAIELAIKNFGGEENRYSYKALILLTDGEDHGSNPMDYVETLKQYGIKVYTIGIATPGGEPIPEKNEQGQVADYVKDNKGQVVVSKPDESLLMNLAAETGGRYYPFMYGETAIIDHLYGEISNIDKKEQKSKMYNLYEHRFQYPLFLAILLLILEFVLPVEIKRDNKV